MKIRNKVTEPFKKRVVMNKGFSLVEVIACIAILAIISVPILAGFRLSAHYNQEAHRTQLATVFAQQVMEQVKAAEMDDLSSLYTLAGTVVDTDLQSQFPATFDPILFTELQYEENGVLIGGEPYNMTITLDPIPYSQPVDDTAADSNINEYATAEEVDTANFAVISSGINEHEGSVMEHIQELDENGMVVAEADVWGSAVLFDLYDRLAQSGQLNMFGSAIQERLYGIYEAAEKTVEVNIVPGSGSDSITINCIIRYAIPGTGIEQFYSAYDSRTYEVRCDCTPGGHLDFGGWESGGNIFIFAKAYKEQKDDGLRYPTLFLGANNVQINNSYSGAHPVDVYFVRGYYTDVMTGAVNGVNFDRIMINSTPYYDGFTNAVLTGETEAAGIRLHTNIKNLSGRILPQVLVPGELTEETVGAARAGLHCYEVRIQITGPDADGDATNDDMAASIVSTKIVTE